MIDANDSGSGIGHATHSTTTYADGSGYVAVFDDKGNHIIVDTWDVPEPDPEVVAAEQAKAKEIDEARQAVLNAKTIDENNVATLALVDLLTADQSET